MDVESLPTSTYTNLKLADPATLDILFSHCFIPVGHFAISHVSSEASHSLLAINTPDNDWYQRGIPGISRSIAETADYFRDVIRALGCTRVRTIGCSMGAYAALLFGDLLDADSVIATDPELEIPTRRMRSWESNAARIFDPAHVDLLPAVIRLGSRATISIGAYDPMEAGTASRLLAAGGQPILTKCFHGNPTHLDWPRIFREPEAPVSYNAAITIEPPSDVVWSQSAQLYREAFDGVARASDPMFSAAREAFPTITLYDAALHCLAGERERCVACMERYAQFRQGLSVDEVGEPVFDGAALRFGISRPRGLELRTYLKSLLPDGR